MAPMNLARRLSFLLPTGSSSPRLSSPAADAQPLSTPSLEVSTAGPLVIVALSLADATAALTALPSAGAGLRLERPGALTLQLVPARQPRLSVKDPQRGWVITVDPARRDALADIAPCLAVGEYEIDDTLALVIEAD